MRTSLILWIICLSISFAKADTGDSSHILLPTDTVILTINDAQQKLITHTIAGKQTLYKISRFYGVSIAKILALNPDKTETNLSIGDKLTIPLPNRAIRRFRSATFHADKYLPLYYRVKRGDTVYGIAKRAFRMPIDTLASRNNLENGISPGQLLHVGWISLSGVSKAKGNLKPSHPLAGKVYREKQFFLAQAKGKKIRKQRGAAYWKKTKSKGTQLYALHNYAPIGSVIEVTNPMSQMVLYVKVIGRINPRVTPANTKVVLSPAAAGYLGALNAKFYTEIRYYR
ncbi:MAG TPA: LysM peptidoglycan-binding domain-containing protein [Saprospiraceae bacterium]|nr:LysM peptidoglycan-binding domain-containing protein [Saprospiraceae bacterium]